MPSPPSPDCGPRIGTSVGFLLSGYDLVTKVLDHPDGGVEALIDLAGGGETEWLEFKAAMVGRHKDRKNPKENDADGHWNVAEAVLAMANTRGGAVLVGIDDDGNTVGLQSCDPRKVIEGKGLEAYRRIEIKDKIRPTNGPCKWDTGIRGIWELEEAWPPDQFSVIGAIHKGQDIAILLVRPVPAHENCIIALHNGEERLLRRTSGDVGQVEAVRGRRNISRAESARSTESTQLFALWERFRRRVEGGGEDAELEPAINDWHRRLRTVWADKLADFIPLDAWEYQECRPVEEPAPGMLSEHEACNPLPDYLREHHLDFGKPDDHVPLDRQRVGKLDLFSSPPRVGSLFALLEQEPRAVILGEPGSGKTTCLKWMALEGVGNYQPGGLVTLFVPLVELGQAGGFWSLIRKSTGFSRGQVERLISSNRCRILLDALNECPDALRAAAVREISGFLRNYPGLPIIISARRPDTTRPFNLPSFFVGNLSDDQRRALLRRFLSDEAKADGLLANLKAHLWGEFLASSPMRLRMLATVAETADELPTGIAALYHRWIGDLYSREAEKERVALNVLVWSLAEVRKALAALAFTARRAGKRLISEKLALGALVNTVRDPHGILQWLSNGLFLLRAEGHLEFPHETFQEYFCAEALLSEPGALKDCDTKDYGTWGMPIAYAAELQNPLPEDLMAAVWRIYPWMGAALVTDAEEIPELLEFCRHPVHWAVTEAPSNLPSWVWGGSIWYDNNPPLSQAVRTSAPRYSRWYRFEVAQLRYARQTWIVEDIVRRSLTLPKSWTEEQLREAKLPNWEWVENCKDPFEALSLCKTGLCKPIHFASFYAKWIATATPIEAAHLVKGGFLSSEDFASRKDEWIEAVKSFEVPYLINAGLLAPEDIVSRKAEWIAKATLVDVRYLMKAEVISINDLGSRWAELVATAPPTEAAMLIDARLLTREDFVVRKADWIATAKPDEAVTLLRAGLLTAEDFASRKDEWVATAEPNEVVTLLRAGLVAAKDLSFRKDNWIGLATPYNVLILIKSRLLALEDFSLLKDEWVRTATPVDAVALIEAGVLKIEDFASWKPERNANSDPRWIWFTVSGTPLEDWEQGI